MDQFYKEIKQNAKTKGYTPNDLIEAENPDERRWLTQV